MLNAATLAPALDRAEFEYFRRELFDRAGIHVSDSKADLVKTRLRARLKALNFSSYAHYRAYLERLPAEDAEWQSFINQLTTNKTDFFREPAHFRFLQEKFLPAWLGTGRDHLRVWSCASSTGEEPYTLAMVLARALPSGKSFDILATDIDTDVLATAENAVYPRARLREVPEEYRSCFQAGTGEIAAWMRLRAELRSKVRFARHNLTAGKAPEAEPFDLLLCRNVLIYFNRETVSQVATNAYAATRPGGFLLIGHSESLQNAKHAWAPAGPSIYRKD